MKITFWLFSIIGLALVSSGQEIKDATVENTFPKYSYIPRITSIQNIDFRNFKLILFDGRKPNIKAVLRDGKFEKHYSIGGYDWLQFGWIKHFHSKRGTERAIVEFDWVSAGASTSDLGVIQVFELKDYHPFVVQQILFNERGSKKAGAVFDSKTEILTVNGVHGWEHCCPSTLDVIKFRWDGTAFNEMSLHTTPIE